MSKLQKLMFKHYIKQYKLSNVTSFADLDKIKEDLAFKEGIYMIFFIDEWGDLHLYRRKCIRP